MHIGEKHSFIGNSVNCWRMIFTLGICRFHITIAKIVRENEDDIRSSSRKRLGQPQAQADYEKGDKKTGTIHIREAYSKKLSPESRPIMGKDGNTGKRWIPEGILEPLKEPVYNIPKMVGLIPPLPIRVNLTNIGSQKPAHL